MPRGRPKGSKNKKTLERETRERKLALQQAEQETRIEEQIEETTASSQKREIHWTEFSGRYFKGQHFYYIYTNDFTGTKVLLEIKVHTVKPNVLICNVEDEPSFICIGPEDEDMLFTSYEEAKKKYKDTTVKPIFNLKGG